MKPARILLIFVINNIKGNKYLLSLSLFKEYAD